MNKAYSRINWQNAPSEATALNETNLNKMDSAIDVIDDRVVAHDTRLDNAEYAIGQAGDSITALQGDVSTLEGTVSTQGSAITALQSGKVDKSNGMGLSTLMNLEAQSRTNTGTIIGALLLDKYGQQVTEIKLRNGIEVDSALSDSSTNPVQNKAIKMVLDEKVDKEAGKGLSSLSGLGITSSANTGDTIADILAIDQNGNEYHNYIKNGVEVDSALSSESENPVQNKAVTTELEKKADADGNYEDMAVGQLLSNTFEEDKAPYNFRTSGGTLEIGDREYDTLVGGSVAFNQLVKNGNFADTSNWSATYGTISASNNECVYTVSAVGTFNQNRISQANVPIINGHKYYISFSVKAPYAGPIRFGAYSTAISSTTIVDNDISTAVANTYKRAEKVVSASATGLSELRFSIGTWDDKAVDDEYRFKEINVIDLTQMFGSTIADYIYSLEQATAGSGVAYFRSLFPKDYYAYNAGQLMSVKALSHKTVGFNAFNVTTGKAKLVGGNLYQITGTYTAISYSTGETLTPDSNGKFTTSASGELTVTGGDNTTCVHLVWDGERDGEYETYSEHIYPLDSDLELRGIPKLDANNNLYYDGDTYESDGTVTRKYGIVDLGSLRWTQYGSGSGYFKAEISDASSTRNAGIQSKYNQVYNFNDSNNTDKSFYKADSVTIIIKDTSYSDATTFKNSLNGVYCVYELATPTTETADTFENPQLVDNWGTEEYTDSREVQIPVGHITKYPPDLKAKLESAPDSPSANGDYILRHNNGVNSYVALTKELPAVPTTDGTYVLKSTVSSGVATLSWVAE